MQYMRWQRCPSFVTYHCTVWYDGKRVVHVKIWMLVWKNCKYFTGAGVRRQSRIKIYNCREAIMKEWGRGAVTAFTPFILKETLQAEEWNDCYHFKKGSFVSVFSWQSKLVWDAQVRSRGRIRERETSPAAHYSSTLFYSTAPQPFHSTLWFLEKSSSNF